MLHLQCAVNFTSPQVVHVSGPQLPISDPNTAQQWTSSLHHLSRNPVWAIAKVPDLHTLSNSKTTVTGVSVVIVLLVSLLGPDLDTPIRFDEVQAGTNSVF